MTFMKIINQFFIKIQKNGALFSRQYIFIEASKKPQSTKGQQSAGSPSLGSYFMDITSFTKREKKNCKVHKIIKLQTQARAQRKLDILEKSFELEKFKILDEACEAKNRLDIAVLQVNLADTNSISKSEILNKPSVDVLKPKSK